MGKSYGDKDQWGYSLMKNTNFDPNVLYKIQDGKKNGWLSYNSGKMMSRSDSNIFNTNFTFTIKKAPDGTFYIIHQGKYLTTTRTLVDGDKDSYIIVLRDQPDTKYSRFKINVENGDHGVFTIEAFSPLNDQWYFTSVWRGRSNAPFGLSQNYTHDKSHSRDNFQYNISEASLSNLPKGLKPNVVYGIKHVKTGLYLTATAGIVNNTNIGVFSTEDEVMWDPNSMFTVEEGGHAQGDDARHYDTTIRIKSVPGNDGKSYYVTANGKYSAGDGQTELMLRNDMGLNGDDQMMQKFLYQDIGGGKARLGGFWNEDEVFLFWSVGKLHHGPNRIATLHTRGDAVNKNYPTVLNRSYYIDGASLPNDEFQFVPLGEIDPSKIKKKENFASSSSEPSKHINHFYTKLFLFIFALILMILVVYFLCKEK